MLKDFLSKSFNLFIRVLSAVHKFLYFGNFKKKHITYGFVNGKFVITSVDHYDYITEVQKKILKFAKKYDRETFIKMVLTEALTGCNFVIFSPPGNDNKYVQFWTGDHSLKYDFCAIKTNGLKKYYYPILGLLSEFEFVDDKIPNYTGKKYFEIAKTKDMITVDANFRIDIDSATKFTETIFKQIYKVKTNKLIVKVE